ncbi:hypothetical protein WICPIJ_005142 [Wickerhamomyces pijperi]|uniref:Uncharacterized protein n=1 Tax=Wickerhamomyces pijperi TaxID=599730 RepID=A0A9P8TM36_WICPI|nr:hypothetical protein WICPIJ_005142 [Wickerhamomyces pijperi]
MMELPLVLTESARDLANDFIRSRLRDSRDKFKNPSSKVFKSSSILLKLEDLELFPVALLVAPPGVLLPLAGAVPPELFIFLLRTLAGLRSFNLELEEVLEPPTGTGTLLEDVVLGALVFPVAVEPAEKPAASVDEEQAVVGIGPGPGPGPAAEDGEPGPEPK